ncbi:Acetyltransferase [Rickettsia akari str. Hartford]|uniref:Acetyltransferase n=1 Tax=Rickettsia akari (strain Hartford) TaxID=293614 RepID=A8GNZ2_RICAH|nr:Acetyltransferase [Rickettsia akari str. Hartford]
MAIKAQPQFWRYQDGAEESQSKLFKELLLQDDYIMLIAEDENKMLGYHYRKNNRMARNGLRAVKFKC